ncbi:ferritin-like domain-containing protein [Paracoccus contaminans]|uniref:YciE/YciF family protein n=1 Tax=Paracoccus contaminans TaxID=1945662 RepID=A0A1W6CYF3_9RHOB|nr:ferritin-like domain-containing protein [Paracoccus contaminans]ARJ69829.1 YciE/YciF family protein [Paracoccus contaminans]
MATEQKGLQDLLKHGLKDIYYAEGKIQKSLPKMIEAAQDDELKSGLEKHLEETAEQISKLEQVFELLGEKAKGEKCDAIEGILKEGDSLLSDFGGTAAGDAAIIFSCQAVEHYEITRYGSLRTYAELLGHDEVASLLDEILDQEEAADDLLTEVAEERVNPMAAEGDSSEDDDSEDEEA